MLGSILSSVALAVALVASGAGVANAAGGSQGSPVQVVEGDALARAGSYQEKKVVIDQLCLDVRAVVPTASCEVTIDTTIADVKPAVAASQRSASAAVSAAAASTCKNWTQTRTMNTGKLWSETHKGQFCYGSGGVTTRSHACDLSSGIGYDVTNVRCNEYKSGAGTKPMVYNDDFRVSFVLNGVPIKATYSIWVNTYSTGTITYHGD